MKLVIQIPCYNEEKTLPLVLSTLPKKILGVSKIEVQIVDDGSTDRTVEVAKKYGCHIVTYVGNKGLGVAFKTGMEEALRRGADILVNTDADNQYPSSYIPALVAPVVNGTADIVIGDRQTGRVKHFGIVKKFFQWLGSAAVRNLSGTNVRDTVSGFRAYSKEAMMQLNVVSKFSYCIDTIIQAGKKGLAIKNVLITTNAPTRRSRLFKNMFQHMKKSGANLLRCYVMYEPFKTFLLMSAPFFGFGLFLYLRFLFRYIFISGAGMIQSLIVGTVSFIFAGLLFAIGILADLNALNRKLTEDILYFKRREAYGPSRIEVRNRE
ncbi:glycosyltransferase family 2 protein [Candidatus Woesearchaeota archaeon]|nr:glycosyltransferase family 2 protein [Candidatus Woesearchaeota archaeon]